MTTLDDLLRQGVGEVYTAVSAEILQNGKSIFHATFGSVDPDGRTNGLFPARGDTFFDLASLTKIFTASAFFRLVDMGMARLDATVGSVLPAFNGPRAIRPYPNPLALGQLISVVPPTGEICEAGEVTFEQLLSHSSGLPAWLNLREQPTQGDRIEFCLHSPFAYPTGSRSLYSDIGFILLGKAIERITRETIDEALNRLVIGPLGLSARYGNIEENVAPTERCSWRRRRLVGEVHDENCATLGGVAGHAGLFGTARDVAALGQTYLDAGGGFIRPGLAVKSTETHIDDRGLGWMKPSGTDSSCGRHFSAKSYGHTGFTGTSLWVDPERKLVCALLTNRVFFGRDPSKIKVLRQMFHDLII